jgi:hypothetical protein
VFLNKYCSTDQFKEENMGEEFGIYEGQKGSRELMG